MSYGRYLIFINLFLLMTACATSPHGFDRGALKKQIAHKSAEYSDAEIQNIMNKKPNLPASFKIAVYFSNPQSNSYAKKWRWTEEDHNNVFAKLKKLEATKHISDIFRIVDGIGDTNNLRGLRTTAARHGADALLIISGVSDIDKYINDLGITYALLLPMLFVPGSEADSLFISTASLWDVRNEYLYFSTEAESLENRSYVAAFGNRDQKVISKIKTKSLAKLSQRIANYIHKNDKVKN